jgi:carbonic anhydrase/acetyltransferase-like protein (isoleucine patch superfamily)
MADHHPIQHGGGPLWSLDGVFPQLHPDAWVAPTAVIIGDVEIAMGASIWFNCVLRGDTNRIRVGARSNVQDAAVLHVNPGEGMECNVGDDVTIGHGAIVHAAHLHDGAFVGMAAVVLDRAVIETGGVLAAGGVLTPGKRIGRNELWAGTPAKLVRVLSDEERAHFALNAPAYVQNAIRFRQGLSTATE